MPEVRSKRQFYELYRSGVFGNRPMTWGTREEVLASGFPGEFAARYKGPGSCAPLFNGLTLSTLAEGMQKLALTGYKEEDYFFNEQLTPGAVTYTINGEVMRGPGGLELIFSTENLMMRDALARSSRSASRAAAVEILRHRLWPGDFEWLSELLDAHPDHVVEFSGFNRRVGILQRRMVVWEVRLY